MMHRLAFHILFFSVLNFSGKSLLAQELTATLAFVKGGVFVEDQEVSDGFVLQENQTLTTKKGTVTLLIGEETVVHIGENSEFLLENKKVDPSQNERVDASLKYGKVRALVGDDEGRKREFELKTRSSVMGVRGTHIYVDSPPNLDTPVQFLTIEGEAVVRLEDVPQPTTAGAPPPPQKEVTLRSSQSIESRADAKGSSSQAPQVQTVSKTQIQNISDNVGGNVGKAEAILDKAPPPGAKAPAARDGEGRSAPAAFNEPIFDDTGEGFEDPFDQIDQIETDLTGEDGAPPPGTDLDPTTDTEAPPVDVEIEVQLD